ncbi:NAD(P)-binding protein [Phlebopus sp. FC_14]|nr:NAD(P)-binding protein [Phlebopus sp. FC_14]
MSPTSELLQAWLFEGVFDCPLTCAVLLSLGVLTLARFAFKTLTVFSQTFVLPGKNLKKFGAKNGAWAVVTGASDGIGKEFALQLATAGFNILLVARNNQMLSAVAAEIGEKTAGKVDTKIQLVDFAKNDPSALKELQTLLRSLDVGVLVNNVGKSHNMPTYFAETTEQENEDIVTINVNGTLRVTHAVLPGMIQRKRGLILNVGSFAGEIPSPMLATYSGTKAFVSTFTDALAEEVKAHNITVQQLNTYFVVSKMSNIRKSSMMVPLPSTYVRSALSKVGLSCGAAMTERPSTLTPFWSHALLDYVIHVIGWKAKFISYTHSLHKDIRRRALRKLEREAKKQ